MLNRTDFDTKLTQAAALLASASIPQAYRTAQIAYEALLADFDKLTHFDFSTHVSYAAVRLSLVKCKLKQIDNNDSTLNQNSLTAYINLHAEATAILNTIKNMLRQPELTTAAEKVEAEVKEALAIEYLTTASEKLNDEYDNPDLQEVTLIIKYLEFAKSKFTELAASSLSLNLDYQNKLSAINKLLNFADELQIKVYAPEEKTSNKRKLNTEHDYSKMQDKITQTPIFKKIKRRLAEDKHTDLNDEFLSLGKISNNPKYYFAPSDETKSLGVIFLSKFWSKSSNVAIVIDRYQTKLTTTKITTTACISFMLLELNSKSICLVKASGEHFSETQQKVNAALKECADEINATAKSAIPFYLLENISDKFMNTFLNISKDLFDDDNGKYQRKWCAEKNLISIYLKILERYPNAKISGITNLAFYPYENGKNNDGVFEIPEKNRIQLTNNFYTDTRGCCAECQKLRYSFFTLATSIQSNTLKNSNNNNNNNNSNNNNINFMSPVDSTEEDIFTQLATYNSNSKRG